jgi:hypothetical protein
MGVDFESLVEATSGAVGGVVSTSILYPLDTCKTKFQAELRTSTSQRYGYATISLSLSLSDGFCDVGFWSGMGSNVGNEWR